MVRISKQAERRNQSPRKRKNPTAKTGPLKDNLKAGYKPHENAVSGDVVPTAFIPKIKSVTR